MALKVCLSVQGANPNNATEGGVSMFGINLSPILAIIAGIMVLLLPKLLRWIIGIFLIVWGVLQLM